MKVTSGVGMARLSAGSRSAEWPNRLEAQVAAVQRLRAGEQRGGVSRGRSQAHHGQLSIEGDERGLPGGEPRLARSAMIRRWWRAGHP